MAQIAQGSLFDDGAQRLSASEIQHVCKFGGTIPNQSCSTPFGIRDSTLLHCGHTVSYANVLNAFRHQRFNITSLSTSALRSISAQRLSASEIQHGLFPVSGLKFFVCAQRLSASEIQHSLTARLLKQ